MCRLWAAARLFLLIVIYLLYYQLDTQTDFYHLNGAPMADAGLIFNLCTLLLPLLYGLYALWQERTHLFQDLLARAAVLVLVVGVAAALGNRYPDSVSNWLTRIHWPALYAPGYGSFKLPIRYSLLPCCYWQFSTSGILVRCMRPSSWVWLDCCSSAPTSTLNMPT